MALNKQAETLFAGFSKLDLNERLQRLQQMGALSTEETTLLRQERSLPIALGEKLIENVIGYFQMPIGVATNFRIDGKDYVIPMAVEETSIIAAVSKTARWIRQNGSITTKIIGDSIIGQIQIARVKDYDKLEAIIATHKAALIHQANETVANGLLRRGGGVSDIQLRRIPRPDNGQMAIIHIHANCVDAMGANILNQILEYLKSPIESLSGETVNMCILSNLNDAKLTHAHVSLSQVPETLAQAIEEASLFANLDPYRASTHNKGVLNGIDPILLATGNDWRAVEAGIHAYAARDGQYRAITSWKRKDSTTLVGDFKAPLVVGTVGGVTALHPTAKLCLKMLGVNKANDLSRIIAAVGLVQNLGALKALTTDGIIKGHMKLHIDNLAMSAGASDKEMPMLKQQLEQWLHYHKRVSLSNAHQILQEIRLQSQEVPA